MVKYVWQSPNWPNFKWDSDILIGRLGQARQCQGRLLAQTDYFGLELQAKVLTEEAITTAAIEGEKLNRDSVRSSVARRLGLPTAGLPTPERHVDGLVEILIDATTHYDKLLSEERIKAWHAALFPTGYSGLIKITVGDWRTKDPMQVVSGPVEKEKVHYEAPPSKRLKKEMKQFLSWWANIPNNLDGLFRAALAHFWFVSIHPFDDGNGRISRAITDMALAHDEGTGRRLYSMSTQIAADREAYYDILEKTQHGDGDLTDWILWFLVCLESAIQHSEKEINLAVTQASFWAQHSDTTLNARQKKVAKRLLEAGPGGFEGGLTNRKYVGMTKTSPRSAKRDIADLVEKDLLVKNKGRGRSVSYDLVWPKNQ